MNASGRGFEGVATLLRLLSTATPRAPRQASLDGCRPAKSAGNFLKCSGLRFMGLKNFCKIPTRFPSLNCLQKKGQKDFIHELLWGGQGGRHQRRLGWDCPLLSPPRIVSNQPKVDPNRTHTIRHAKRSCLISWHTWVARRVLDCSTAACFRDEHVDQNEMSFVQCLWGLLACSDSNVETASKPFLFFLDLVWLKSGFQGLTASSLSKNGVLCDAKRTFLGVTRGTISSAERRSVHKWHGHGTGSFDRQKNLRTPRGFCTGLQFKTSSNRV